MECCLTQRPLRSLLPLVVHREAHPDVQNRTIAASKRNLWAWYDNPFFAENGRTQLLDFATFVFFVDVTSAFTESVFSVVKGTKTVHRGRRRT